MSADVIPFPKQPKPRPAPAFDANALVDEIFRTVTDSYRRGLETKRDEDQSR